MKFRASRFSVFFLLAGWVFVTAAFGFAGSFRTYLEITSVVPSSQRQGKPITITVKNAPSRANTTNVKVKIGGNAANVIKVSIISQGTSSGYVTAEITAVVPRNSSGSDKNPLIEVEILGALGGVPAPWGEFSIQPEDLPPPVINSVKPSVQRVGERVIIEVTGLPQDKVYPRNVSVTFDGKQADVSKVLTIPPGSATGTVRAEITAVLPKTLSASKPSPVINVSVAGYTLSSRGKFSIQADNPSPTIARVTPTIQQKGYPITIEIGDAPEVLDRLLVTIGGETAVVESVGPSGRGQAFITAVVPGTLSDDDLQPEISVSFQNYLLRYEGKFTIQQEVPATGDLTPAPSFAQRVMDRPTLLIAAAVVVLAGLGSLAFYYIDSRRKRLLLGLNPSTFVDGLEPIDVPDPSPELISAVRGGRCVVVIGPGMSAEAGLRTASSLLNTIIGETLDSTQATQYLKLLEAGRLDAVIDSLNSVLAAGLLAKRIVELMLKQKPRSTSAYSRLAELPVSAVVSLNLDDLAVNAFRKRQPPVFVPREAEHCLDTLSRHEFFVFMLNGKTDEPDEVLLSQQNLKDAISGNDALRDLLKRLYYARPLLFLGVSLSGVQSFLQMIDRTAPASQRHFALVEVSDSTWQPIARNLDTTFKLSVLPFTPDSRDGANARFLRQIAGFLRQTGLRPQSSTAPIESPTGAKITRLKLRNIGPFTSCDLKLDSKWTVILGDNGVGKSTVLRALAVCIGGKATEQSAARLLRSGATSGSIAVLFGDREYVTTIQSKSGGGFTIDSLSGVPLEREVILAVGFSALRTVGWHRGKASTATPQRPNASDLIPLTSEEPDPRLDGIKQWIVRLDHLKTSDSVSEEDRKRYGELYKKVFDTLGGLAAGVYSKPGTVNPNTGEITITTKDGLVSFESLSQGTLSLVGWTGTLMQRLYETAPVGVAPLESAAIVLVDEIDAHMHPAWQQTLVEKLSETFPNVQFIVTSHSPLVVGGLEPKQVYRFERDIDGFVQISQPDYPLKGLGAAGLLTSGLFGLASHLDTETSNALNRKRQLTAKKLDNKKISGDELEELGKLEEKLANVDFTNSVRDPMYKRFVAAISKVEAGDQEGPASAPIVLTAKEEQKKVELAEEIVRELISDADSDSARTQREESPS